VLGAAMALSAASAQAVTRYVAATGNDNGGVNTCQSQATPCRHISHAVAVALGGDTIQIGPGEFQESVDATAKRLSFVGAGGPPNVQTIINAHNTPNPGFTLGAHAYSFENLAISGGIGAGPTVEPAIYDAGGTSAPSLTISDCLLEENAPANPATVDATLYAAGTAKSKKVTVSGSTIGGDDGGILVAGPQSSLTVDHSEVLVPVAHITGPVLPLTGVAITSIAPLTITDSQVVGTSGINASGHTTTITRTLIGASAIGVKLIDSGDGPTLTMRDSTVSPAAGGNRYGVVVTAPSFPSTEKPSIDLTFDSILSLQNPAHALDVTPAAPGTVVHTRNTILRALDPVNAHGAADIASGSQAINWDVGYTDYTTVTGIAVPPPGSGTNINAPPGFKSEIDLRLNATSTLFDRGDPTVVTPGETDLAGDPRSLAHSCGAAPRPDVGAYEGAAPSCPAPTISLTSPANHASYAYGQSVTASFSCAAPPRPRSAHAPGRSPAAPRSTRRSRARTSSRSPRSLTTARRRARASRTPSSRPSHRSASSARVTRRSASAASWPSSPARKGESQ
jgi:hypothetical protein